MSHDHSHHHAPDDKNIKSAFFINLIFTIIEIIGGLLTNSVAIIADAIHDFGDSISLGLAWYLQNLSKKGRTPNYSFGYRRFSVLGALITSIILIIGSGIIVLRAWPRFFNPQETNTQGMIGLAILGVIMNGYAVLKLQNRSSLNERVVKLHLLEDVLGWIAVLIGAIIMHFTKIYWIDPLLSILIAVFVLRNVVKNLKQVIQIIMQGRPLNVDVAEIESIIQQTEHLVGFHDLHIWTMDGEYNVLTVHLVVPDALQESEIIQLKQSLKHQLEHADIEHVTIEIERVSEDCNYEHLHE